MQKLRLGSKKSRHDVSCAIVTRVCNRVSKRAKVWRSHCNKSTQEILSCELLHNNWISLLKCALYTLCFELSSVLWIFFRRLETGLFCFCYLWSLSSFLWLQVSLNRHYTFKLIHMHKKAVHLLGNAAVVILILYKQLQCGV